MVISENVAEVVIATQNGKLVIIELSYSSIDPRREKSIVDWLDDLPVLGGASRRDKV